MVSFGSELLVALRFIKAMKRHSTLPESSGFAQNTPQGLSLCGARVSVSRLIHFLWCQNIMSSGAGAPCHVSGQCATLC